MSFWRRRGLLAPFEREHVNGREPWDPAVVPWMKLADRPEGWWRGLDAPHVWWCLCGGCEPGGSFETNAAHTFFDGNTTDPTGDLVYAFTGPVNASSSTRSTFAILNARIREVIEDRKTPTRLVSRIVWNAQQDPALAATLDVQDRIRVRFQGQTQDSRIIGLKHDMRGDRWVVTLDIVESS